MTIKVRSEVKLKDLADSIAQQSSYAEIIEFILDLDTRVGDFSFTNDLIITLLSTQNESYDEDTLKFMERMEEYCRGYKQRFKK